LNIPQKWVPISIEAEESLLGAILLNNDAHGRVSDIIEPHHFGEPLLGHIYDVASTLIRAGKLANPITVQAFLPPMVYDTGVKTKTYVARIAAASTTIINAIDYAKHVRELADRRQIAEIALLMAPDAATEAVQLAAEAIEQLDAIVTSRASTGAPSLDMRQAMIRAIEAAATAYQDGSHIQGVPTTLRDLDSRMGGMARGDLVILGGRPGMGKSAALLTMLRRQAEKGFKSILFSLEMSDIPMSHRMISDYIFDLPGDNISYSNLKKGNFHEKMFTPVQKAATAMSALPIRIEQQPGLTVSQIAARARQHKRRHGLDVLAVDHLDLVRASGRYAGNKVYELGETTAALKALAKEMDIVVLLLCQLSREVEKREDKRPQLADLRSSGSIEQDADTVIFLYRHEYYLASKEPQAATPEYELWQNEIAKCHNKLLAIIAKQRSGPTGSVELFCDIGHNAIRDLNNDYPGAN
jgi:replicative DNA helicase